MPKTSRKKPNFLIILIIILLLSFILWNYHSHWLVSQLSWETVRQDWIKHEKKAKVIFANTEISVTAPAEGSVTYVREEGRRFKKGETVAIIAPSGVNHGSSLAEVTVTAPISGLFYSFRDNLEEVMTPENLMNMDLEGLLIQAENNRLPDHNSADNGEKLVSRHAPIGKMLNNLYPSWMFVYLESADSLAKDEIVKFRVGQEEYSGTVMKVSGQPRGAVVRFTQYVKGTTENRIQEVVWIYKPASKGLVVPVSSLFTFGEERGVYIGENGIIRFRNVKVLDSNESLACVVGIPEGVQVVINPVEGIEDLPYQ